MGLIKKKYLAIKQKIKIPTVKLSKSEREFRGDIRFIVKDIGKHSTTVERKLDKIFGKSKKSDEK